MNARKINARMKATRIDSMVSLILLPPVSFSLSAESSVFGAALSSCMGGMVSEEEGIDQ
jgi:hypothetical protein